MSEQTSHPRPSRAAAIARLAVPLLLAGLAAAGLIYAVGFHTIPVLAEQPKPEPAAPQVTFPFLTPTPPAPQVQTVTLQETEPKIVREVSVGGVARLDSGEIKRTYTGDKPSLCPT